MTTRFDKTRENLLAGVDASRSGGFLTEIEAFRLTTLIEDHLKDLEDEHPREERV